MASFSRTHLNYVYSEIVSEYVCKRGFKICTETMEFDHQDGCVCHIDLMCGLEDIVRIWMVREVDSSRRDVVKIAVRLHHLNDCLSSPTYGRPLIDDKIFYEIKRDQWYTDSEEEFAQIEQLRNDRWDARFIKKREKWTLANIPESLKKKAVTKIRTVQGMDKAGVSCLKNASVVYDPINGWGKPRRGCTIGWEFDGKSGVLYLH